MGVWGLASGWESAGGGDGLSYSAGAVRQCNCATGSKGLWLAKTEPAVSKPVLSRVLTLHDRIIGHLPCVPQTRSSRGAHIVALPRVGGLHHRYEWMEAALPAPQSSAPPTHVGSLSRWACTVSSPPLLHPRSPSSRHSSSQVPEFTARVRPCSDCPRSPRHQDALRRIGPFHPDGAS